MKSLDTDMDIEEGIINDTDIQNLEISDYFPSYLL
jgi:hypothetical protein